MTRALPQADRAVAAAPSSPQAVSPVPASIPSAKRVQRWFRRFDTAPMDGTAFSLPHIYRFNPVAKHWEGLFLSEDGGKEWGRVDFSKPPTWWCPLPPLSFELPSQGWFSMHYTVTCTVRPKTWRERLLGKLMAQPAVMIEWLNVLRGRK